MDESRRVWSRIVIAMGVPLLVILMVPLALLAALGFYLLAIVHGVWLLIRDLPGRVLGHGCQTPLKKPHFLAARSPTNFVD